MGDSDRRVAIVTGANRGLGREIGRRLGEQGVTVALAGRDRSGLCSVSEDMIAGGARAFPLVLDVCSRAAIRSAVDEVLDRCGRIDILVNNAGILIDDRAGMSEVPVNVVEATFETNFFGPMLLSQRVLPVMRSQRYGRIVNMSSSLGTLNEIGRPRLTL